MSLYKMYIYSFIYICYIGIEKNIKKYKHIGGQYGNNI